MEKLMKMMRMTMKTKMRMKKMKNVGKVKRGREKQMMKEKMINKTPVTCKKKELFSIGWTADMDLVAVFFFKEKKKKGSCDTNPRTPTQPKSQRIVPVTFHLPPFSPSWIHHQAWGLYPPKIVSVVRFLCKTCCSVDSCDWWVNCPWLPVTPRL